MNELLVDIIGWLGAVLIVGSYALNMYGKLAANSYPYIWANIVGAIFFAVNSYSHDAMPSVAVNIVWIAFAVISLVKKR
jgi:hypothetical protein